MNVLASVRGRRFGYALARDEDGGWVLLRGTSRGREAFALDHDQRHERLFLSEGDQARVGVEGLVALEELARRVLPRQR